MSKENEIVHTFHFADIYSQGLLIISYRTLYCAKGNYDFGISRVIKSLEPYNKKVISISFNVFKAIFSLVKTAHKLSCSLLTVFI